MNLKKWLFQIMEFWIMDYKLNIIIQKKNRFVEMYIFVILRIKYKFFERKHKYIKTYGPLIRYQAYLWYLKTNNNYLYELDIINKMNGKPEILQTDNGKEFINKELKIYLFFFSQI